MGQLVSIKPKNIPVDRPVEAVEDNFELSDELIVRELVCDEEPEIYKHLIGHLYAK